MLILSSLPVNTASYGIVFCLWNFVFCFGIWICFLLLVIMISFFDFVMMTRITYYLVYSCAITVSFLRDVGLGRRRSDGRIRGVGSGTGGI